MSNIWNICFVATCLSSMILQGCSNTGGAKKSCAVVLNSKNGNQMLKLIPNSQQKNYAGIISCGSNSPVLVGMFDSCLDAESDKSQISSLFASYCGGSEIRGGADGTTASPTAVGFRTVASNETFKFATDGKDVVASPSPSASTNAPSVAPTAEPAVAAPTVEPTVEPTVSLTVATSSVTSATLKAQKRIRTTGVPSIVIPPTPVATVSATTVSSTTVSKDPVTTKAVTSTVAKTSRMPTTVADTTTSVASVSSSQVNSSTDPSSFVPRKTI